MSKAIINALAMALAMEEVMDLPTALQWATDWVEQNGDLFAAPALTRVTSTRDLPQLQPTGMAPVESGPEVGPGGVPLYGNETWQRRQARGEGETAVAAVHIQHLVGPDGLTDKQRVGAATVGLCPNCQQPVNAHLPGCLRDPKGGFTEAERSRVVTKAPLPPSS